MSLAKKILFLFILLISLIIYTLMDFDYKNNITTNTNEDSFSFDASHITKYTNEILVKFNSMKEELINSTGMKKEQKTLEEPLDINAEAVEKPQASKTEDLSDNLDEVKETQEIEVENPQKVLENSENTPKTIENEEIVEESETIEPITNSIENTKKLQSMINDVLNENKITFKRRSVKVTDDSNITLGKVAQILKDNEFLTIEVAGHTDSRGKASLNKRLSQQRANSVRDILISLGIDKNRLKAVGYGEKFPIAKDDKDGLSEINRRVEINIIKEKK